MEKRKIAFSEPEWLQLTSTAALIDPWVAITDIFTQVPSLVEAFDRCQETDQSDGLEYAISELARLEEALAAWHLRYRPELAPLGPWLVSYTNMRYVKELKPPPALNQVHRFANWRAGILYILFHGIRWDLLRTRLEMDKRAALLPASPLDAIGITASISECAFQIARSAAFTCQSRFGSAGRISTLIGCKYAAGIFMKDELFEEAQWCSQLATRIRENSLCQPRLWAIST